MMLFLAHTCCTWLDWHVPPWQLAMMEPGTAEAWRGHRRVQRAKSTCCRLDFEVIWHLEIFIKFNKE